MGKLCIGWRQDDRILVLIVKQESGYGSRWRHSPGIKGREGTGDLLQDWIPISLWSNCSCFSGFCSFQLVLRFQFYLISLSTRAASPHLAVLLYSYIFLSVSVSSHPCLIPSVIRSSSTTTSLGCNLTFACETSSVDMWHLELTQQGFYINPISFTECQFGQ